MNQFTFEDEGRTFTCEAAASMATPDTIWWWVRVSGDGQKYAAFHKAKGDTVANLKPRIIAYYAKVLADRERFGNASDLQHDTDAPARGRVVWW